MHIVISSHSASKRGGGRWGGTNCLTQATTDHAFNLTNNMINPRTEPGCEQIKLSRSRNLYNIFRGAPTYVRNQRSPISIRCSPLSLLAKSPHLVTKAKARKFPNPQTQGAELRQWQNPVERKSIISWLSHGDLKIINHMWNLVNNLPNTFDWVLVLLIQTHLSALL